MGSGVGVIDPAVMQGYTRSTTNRVHAKRNQTVVPQVAEVQEEKEMNVKSIEDETE
eukprot:gene8732-18012_t